MKLCKYHTRSICNSYSLASLEECKLMRFEIGKQTGNILDDVYLLLCHKYHYNSNFQNCSQWFQQLYYFCPCVLTILNKTSKMLIVNSRTPFLVCCQDPHPYYWSYCWKIICNYEMKKCLYSLLLL